MPAQREADDIRILASVYQKLVSELPYPPPECGGILGCKDNTICEIWIDSRPQVNDALVYEPDIKGINHQIYQWQKNGVRFCGLFHSHIAEEETLSGDDITYIRRIVRAIPRDYGQLLFPVVIPNKKVILYYANGQDNDLYFSIGEIELVRDKGRKEASYSG